MTTSNNEVVQIVKQRSDRILELIIAALLAICGYFLIQTVDSIKTVEKELSVVRVAVEKIDAARITRQEVRELIADYHNNHPCIWGKEAQK